MHVSMERGVRCGQRWPRGVRRLCLAPALVDGVVSLSFVSLFHHPSLIVSIDRCPALLSEIEEVHR